MVKCGKGCMPECQFFTTGGCISPFNCTYKVETGYINTATSVIGSYTQGKDDLNEHKINKWFRSLVDEGKIQQEPMNYDAATLQIYIDHLEKENAALRERLEKAVELPSIRKHFTKDGVVYELVYKDDLGFVHTKWCDRDDIAEVRLAELKGEEKNVYVEDLKENNNE